MIFIDMVKASVYFRGVTRRVFPPWDRRSEINTG